MTRSMASALVRKPSTLEALIGYFTPSHVIYLSVLQEQGMFIVEIRINAIAGEEHGMDNDRNKLLRR